MVLWYTFELTYLCYFILFTILVVACKKALKLKSTEVLWTFGPMSTKQRALEMHACQPSEN